MMTQQVGDNGPVSNHPMGPEDLALRGELSANVVGFCRLLRTKGAGVGPSETTDALLALEKIALGNQGHFFGALKTCLAKNQIEQEIFDTHFDSYWKVWDRAGELSKGLNSQEKQDKNVHHPHAPEQKPAVKSVLAGSRENKTQTQKSRPPDIALLKFWHNEILRASARTNSKKLVVSSC